MAEEIKNQTFGGYSCYNCNKELKKGDNLIKLDLGQGDVLFFHDKCLNAWIQKNAKIFKIK